MTRPAPLLFALTLLIGASPIAMAAQVQPLDLGDDGELTPTAADVPVMPVQSAPIQQQQQRPSVMEQNDAEHPVGMKHFSVTDTAGKKPVTKATPSRQDPDLKPADTPNPIATEVTGKKYAPIAAKDALITQDKLRPWANMSQTAMATTKQDAINLVKAIEADRGAVPPQGLFLAAKALSDQGYMDHAAVYYFVGQMRLSFDTLRWPPYDPNAGKKKNAQKDRKSQDQQLPNANANTGPTLVNPNGGVAALGTSIGTPIVRWALRHPDQMHKDLQTAATWDSSAPFAYDPGYPIDHPIPYDEWEGNLGAARQAYFTDMNNALRDIKKIQR